MVLQGAEAAVLLDRRAIVCQRGGASGVEVERVHLTAVDERCHDVTFVLVGPSQQARTTEGAGFEPASGFHH